MRMPPRMGRLLRSNNSLLHFFFTFISRGPKCAMCDETLLLCVSPQAATIDGVVFTFFASSFPDWQLLTVENLIFL